MACPGHIDRVDRNQCQVVITRVEISFFTSVNLHLLRGYWSVLTSPGCPVGDDLSSVLAEISYFARRIRQANPRASPSLTYIPTFRSFTVADLEAASAGQDGSVVRRGAAGLPTPHDLQA